MQFLLVSLLLLLPFVYSEEKLIFAYSYAMAGTGYPKHKILKWTYGTSLSITPAGTRQQYILGRELRNRLILNKHLLDKHYNPLQLIVRPLMVDRGVASANAFIAGLYYAGTGELLPNDKARLNAKPPNKYDFGRWIERLGWSALNHSYQVVPLTLNGESVDSFLDPEHACHSLKDFIVKRTGNWKLLFTKELGKIAWKLDISPSTVKDIIHLSELRELVLEGIIEGRYIDNYPSDLAFYYESRLLDSYIDNTNFLEVGDVSKLVSTPILTDIKQKFEEVHKKAIAHNIENDELKYVSLIGINRRVLLALLRQLGISPKEGPLPASIFLLELYEIKSGSGDSQFEVRYTYDGQTGSFSFADFINKIKSSTYTEAEFKKRCDAK